MTETPTIALTCGEPGGIGPELVQKVWLKLRAELNFFWIGDPAHLPASTQTVLISDPAEAAGVIARGVPVLAHDFGPEPPISGQPQPAHAAHVIAVIKRAVDMAQSGQAGGICTLPISKKALKDGTGFAFPGHTEFLADITGADHVAMMLVCDQLRVVPVTIHVPLAEVTSRLNADLLSQTIKLTAQALRGEFGIADPRIAVAGLNPHAGEGGMLGSEEETLITPVLDRLRGEGLSIAGPLPADTMFHARARARYDAAIAMYHDQALVPIKTLAFDQAVNVTLGLPIVRTSPDHGTAFDIAGKGQARADSTIAALRLAAKLAGARQCS